MESFTQGYKTKIPRYNGGPNFERWKTSVQCVLMSMEVWDIVQDVEKKPTFKTEGGEQSVSGVAEAARQWRVRNHKALEIIYNSLGDDAKPALESDSAAALWTEIDNTYGRRTRADVGHLVRSLVERRKKPEETMQKFITFMTDTYREIVGTRAKVVNEDLLIILLATSLPTEYSSTSISIMNDKEVTIAQVKALLMSAESTIKQNKAASGGGTGGTGQTVSAAAATTSPATGGGARSDPPRNTCTFCKKPYHTQENCWERPENASKRPAGWQTGLHGTTARARAATVDGSTSGAVAAAVAQSTAGTRVLVARTIPDHTALQTLASTDPDSLDLILDSGASQHMFSDVRCFESLRPSQHTVSTCEDGRTVLPIGQGTAVVSVEGKQWHFHDALCIPALNCNLISLSRVQHRGGHWNTQGSHTLDVASPGGDVLSAVLQTDGLYHVSARLVSLPSEVVDSHRALAASSPRTPAQARWLTLHQSFGHVNDAALEASLRHFNINCPRPAVPLPCAACAQGKSSQRSFPARPASARASRPLERIHVDLCGPLRTTTLQGARYFLTLTDDYSRMCWAIPVPDKRNIPLAIRLWTETMEVQKDAKLAILRSDNGGEFTGSDFQDWLRQKSITQELTVPNTPQQNGVAERLNRTLLQMVRTWLVEGELDPQLWGELVITAAYLRNHVWNATTQKVPLALWDGASHTPTMPALVPIGPCWVDRNLPGQDKLAPRAVPGVLLGYHDSKTYRVLLEGQSTITLATTVRQRHLSIPVSRETSSNEPLLSEEDDPTDEASSTLSSDLPNAGESSVTESTLPSLSVPPPSTSADNISPLAVPAIPSPTAGGASPMPTDLEIAGETPVVAADGLASPQIEGEQLDASDDNSDAPRQSSRPRRAPDRYGLTAVIQEERHIHQEALPTDVIVDGTATSTPADPIEPKTFDEAVQGPHQAEWRKAIDKELDCLAKNNTWQEVPLPSDAHTITAKWVFKLKRDASGQIVKFKARLVARGFSQVEGIDYTETFAPVSRLASFRMFLAQAVARRMFIHHLDVETAFLYGDCDADIYLVPPKGYSARRGHVLKLQKSLYGLKQAPRIWHAKLTATMASIGFKESLAEPCLFERDNDIDEYAALIMYVDDLGLAFSSLNSLNAILEQLRRAFVVNDLGPISWYLGIRVDYDRQNGIATLDQATYIQSMLTRFAVEANTSVESPMAVQHDNVVVASHDYDSPYFASMIGSILYAAQGTRFDVAFAVSFLSRSLQRVTKAAHRVVIRLLRYLALHRDQKLIYRCTDTPTDLVVKGYSDADFATDPSRHSVSGFIFFSAGGPVSWASKRQTKIAVNTQEAELTATFAAAKEALWLAKFYATGMAKRAPYGTDLIRKPICLLGDSQNALAYLKKQGAHERTKHYDVELKWLQQVAGRLLLTFAYIPSMVNIADILTKAVAPDTHIRLRALATAALPSSVIPAVASEEEC
ncbi:unnamed protein product [Parajaminaea phylloscopi]